MNLCSPEMSKKKKKKITCGILNAKLSKKHTVNEEPLIQR